MSPRENLTDCEQWLCDAMSVFRRSTEATATASAVMPPANFFKHHEQLLAAAYAGDQNRCDQVLQDFCSSGQQDRTSAVRLLLPVIYRIESNWQTDARSYSDTLYAFWNLQQLMQRHADRAVKVPMVRPHAGPSLRILLSTAPGCDHNIGILTVADYFRLQGWPVEILTTGSWTAILDRLSTDFFDCLGLSVGHDAALEGLADLVQESRSASQNIALRIMIGGNIFWLPKSEYSWIGADHLAVNAHDAYAYCASLIQAKPH